MFSRDSFGRRLSAVIFILFLPFLSLAGALEDYLGKADDHFAWTVKGESETNHIKIHRLEMTSQQWRDSVWKHRVVIVRPDTVRNSSLGFLFVTGDGDGMKQVPLLETLADRAGVICAVVTKVPNQPLYDGKKEDALIAYTFDQYLTSGDVSWPLLFPMVKSAVRAMDTVQGFSRTNFNQNITQFVVSGASKRGWTTWLTGATDKRVVAIAPMVIDMLNMKTQTRWAEKVYGKQSEQIRDYTDLNLVDRMDDARMVQLRSWVDPYSYRQRYTLPKLLLLGSNDPYWTVDSLRHYWNDLPEPKLVFQTPNAGHDLGGGKEATQTLAAWLEMIADHKSLPKMSWTIENHGDRATLSVSVDRPVNAIRLWTAGSSDRDFRDETWSSEKLEVKEGKNARTEVSKNGSNYRAFLLEAELTSPSGHPYKLSTEARVVPDNIKLDN